jgi:hypothetical protein
VPRHAVDTSLTHLQISRVGHGAVTRILYNGAREDRMLASLDRHGWNSATAPVFIQSFETNLRELRPKTKIKLIQLLEGRFLPMRNCARSRHTPTA